MPKRRDQELLRAVGAHVRRMRTDRGMTQEDLAAAAQIQSETVSRIETGRVSSDLTTLAAVADGLGVSLAELMDVRPAPPLDPTSEEALWRAALANCTPTQRTALLALLTSFRSS